MPAVPVPPSNAIASQAADPGHRWRQRRWMAGAGLVLLALALLLYLLTLDNGLQPQELEGGDLITHQYAQVQARPSNAPGYPLYTLGGWAWFHSLRTLAHLLGAPLPNPIPLLSSYSTLWALLALALLYLILCRLTRSAHRPAGNWPLAWLLTAFYAVTYFFWYYATTTEQYTSAIAQTLAIVYVYLLWSDAADRQARSADRRLILLAFLCGLSLAHMLTVAFIVPPLVLAVLWQQPQLLRNWRMLVLCVLAALLPLAAYSYVWLRGAGHPEWWGQGDWRTPQEWFWSFVSTAQGRDELRRGFQPTCAFFAGGFPALIWQELSAPLLLLGLMGVAFLRRRLAFVLYGTFVFYLIFDWLYRCGNWYQVILPVYPLLLLGVAELANRWQEHWGKAASRRWLQYAPALLLVVAIGWRFTASFQRANSHNRPDDTALAHAGVLLGQPLPPQANLFAQVQDALALDYLVEIWGIQPSLRLVSSGQAGRRLRAGETVLTTYDAAPVLLSELPADLAPQRAALSPDWLQLTRKPAPPPTPAVTLNRQVTPQVTLVGATVAAGPTGAPVTQAAPSADVTLVWSLAQGWPAELGISLRPTQAGAFLPDPGQGDGSIVQVDAPAPLHGLLPAGATGLVADAYRVPLPAGADGLMVIVYRHNADGSFTNLMELPLESVSR